jgi:hypothetical protein
MRNTRAISVVSSWSEYLRASANLLGPWTQACRLDKAGVRTEQASHFVPGNAATSIEYFAGDGLAAEFTGDAAENLDDFGLFLGFISFSHGRKLPRWLTALQQEPGPLRGLPA